MKIVWAVDPFETDVAILRAAARAIRTLVTGVKAEVQPLYVWSRSPIAIVKPSRGFDEDLQLRGQEELASAVSKIAIPGLKELEVHPIPFSGRRDEARELVDRAAKAGADLIVVSSHGKKGIKRAVLGSFAETLSLTSEVPLFIVRADSRTLPVRNILFPTDFSNESLEAFEKVVAFAKARKSHLTIFHKIALAPFPALDIPVANLPSRRAYFDAEARSLCEKGKDLAELAARHGVHASVVIDRSSPGSVSETIVRRAKKAGALIALCSRSGTLSGLLLGSTTRQVLRQADVPVWVIHPGQKRVRKPLFEVTARDIERDLYERPA